MSHKETIEDIERTQKAEAAGRDAREARALYRRVFGTPEGIRVLGAVLLDMGFFSIADNPERVALKNYATDFVVNKLGINSADLALRTTEFWIEIGK